MADNKATRSLLALCLIWTGNVSAQDKSIYELTLKELLNVKVVTAASGFEQKLKRAASNATVITREEWQAMGAVTLADALASVLGVHIAKSTINYKHNMFSLRGLSGSFNEQVKLLVDGHHFENAQDSGRFNGFNMPLHNFKRIEIIKGPGSAIYGADAFGGVINLVSYRSEAAPSNLSIAYGSFNSQSLAFQDHYSISDLKLNFSLDYISSDDDRGRKVERDLQSQLDDIFNTNASNAPGAMDEHYQVLSTLTQLQWRNLAVDLQTYYNFDMGLGVGIAQALDSEGSASSALNRLSVSYALDDWFEQGDFDLKLNYYKGKSRSYLKIFPSGTTLPIGSDGNIDFVSPVGITHFPDGLIGTPGNNYINRSLLLTRLFNWQTHTVRWEVGYHYQDFQSLERKNFGPGILDGTQQEVSGALTDVTNTPWIFLPSKTRHFYYLSLLDEWDISENLLLNLGARFDHYSDFGSTTNPRIGLNYHFSPTVALKLFSGTAFRAPSYAELYSQNNPVGLGNPNLEAEGVRTLESGFNLDVLLGDNLYFNLSLFNYSADNLIRYAFVPEINGSQAQNIGRQDGYGGEFTMRWKPQNDITVNFHYSKLKAEDNNGSATPYVPNTMWYMDMNWRIDEHWQWYISSKWIKDRWRATSDNRLPVDDYSWVRTKLSYLGLMPGLTLSLSANNLLDSDAREPSSGSIVNDYPLAGRQWRLSMDYQF